MSSLFKHLLNVSSSSKNAKSTDVKSLRRKSDIVVRDKTHLGPSSLLPDKLNAKGTRISGSQELKINVEDYDLLTSRGGPESQENPANGPVESEEYDVNSSSKSNLRRHSVPETSAAKQAIAQALDTILEVTKTITMCTR
jgi:hypothetical protein